MMDESVNRRRISGSVDAANRKIDDQPSASGAILCRTVAVETYPLTAKAMYGLQCLTLSVPQNEGASPTFTIVGDVFFGLNIGSAIPPAGTNLLAFPGFPSVRFVYD